MNTTSIHAAALRPRHKLPAPCKFFCLLAVSFGMVAALSPGQAGAQASRPASGPASVHEAASSPLPGFGPRPELPAPDKKLLPTVNLAKAVGWPANAQPTPASGLAVSRFAQGLDHPRWLYTLPNGDVLVAETNAPKRPEDSKGVKAWLMKKAMKRAGAGTVSADRITLLRDADGDGVAELKHPFLTGLYSPFGMALVGDQLYVANTDAVVRFPYKAGDTRISVAGVKVADLPGGELNHHWTKSLIASRDGQRLFVGVGSNSNVAEKGMDKEAGRAAVWVITLPKGDSRVYASGLRNPVGMDWEPQTGALWVAVNERDELGDDLVPDYMTVVRDGGFYGWPYSYFGANVDERVKPQRPDLVAKALVPDYALGAHTASLGLAFSRAGAMSPRFEHGAFVGQHGSWNREPLAGYKVVFVPFKDGRPNGMPMDVLTGFLNDKGQAQGRPAGVALDRHGALLVADDVGNIVWRVHSTAAPVRKSRGGEHE